MANYNTQQAVLDAVGAKNVSEVIGEKFKRFVDISPDIDSQIKKAFIEKLPEFQKSSTDALREYRALAEKMIESVSDDNKTLAVACMTAINELTEMLKTSDLTFEQKERIIEKMGEFIEVLKSAGKDNKDFLLKIAGFAHLALVAVGAVAVWILGGKSFKR